MKNYHFCISGGDEIIFRSEDDYIRAFNTLALAVSETGSLLFADAIMSTHLHGCVRTDNLQLLLSRFWKSYTRYFNSKYHRQGTLGSLPYIVEIQGFYHWMTAICYVLRNPVHHGVSPIPFAYRHCSANAIFRKETGKVDDVAVMPRKSYYKYLPKGANCPSEYVMDHSGLIKRETVLALPEIEHMFGTPRSYLFYMNRLSGEEWKREQEKDDNNIAPITLESLENKVSTQTLSEMLGHEYGRGNYRSMSDIELCEYLDLELLPSLGKRTVYDLSCQEKNECLRLIRKYTHVSEHRARRSLVL